MDTRRVPAVTPEVPSSSPAGAHFGSDAMADVLRALDIPFLALNPGASYRGLHDSLVNHLGNSRPQMLLCLHEENAVSIAQGYAKASDRMMGAVVHSNVGLMHATMPIFNAWCDRAPVLVIGATGPWDASKRRPWIDWIHTMSDQGALVRGFTKWDNQPGSVEAARESLLRGAQIAMTAPRGPVYVNLDAALQEQKIEALPALPDVTRYAAPEPALPAPHLVEQAAKLLSGAKSPAILMGRFSRGEKGWKERVALAEKLHARVFTDLKTAASFPTDHALHAAPPETFMPPAALAALRECDVILSLDWVDLGGTLKLAWEGKPVPAKVIHVSGDAHLHRGASMDYQGLPPVDCYLMCEADVAVTALLGAVKARSGAAKNEKTELAPATDLSVRGLAQAYYAAAKGRDVCLTHLPLGWSGAFGHFRHPLDYLGQEGGGGVGSGPGITVGAALALKGSGRIPVGILGDGDFMMANSAVWTAVHYGIPCLMVIANNRSFFNDEVHQERVAKMRERPVENKWIGQRMDSPEMDLAMIARGQGAEGIGPVKNLEEVEPAIRKGLELVEAGKVCIIDARVLPGYEGAPSGTGSSKRS
jgi:thiamine pyrophosphate-dependent acetolactate synthase large subunit-like protein